MLVMALDVGSSSTRAQCFDDRARPLPEASARVTYDATTTADGGVELDPEALLEAVARAVDGCVERCGPRAPDIRAVGLSAFWHSLLALDAGGAPLTPVFTWADTRSAAAAAQLRRRLDARAVHERTGAPLHATFFPARLGWLRQARPAVFARAATWCGFGEYLTRRLTGGLQVSISMASGTGLMDQTTGGWDRELLAACDIGPERLPPIGDEPAAALAAPFTARWPALARARWHPAWGDGACSNLGSDCAGPDRLALNVGTSSALRMVAREGFGPAATPEGLWRYRVDAARTLVGGATSEGGNVVAWCRHVLSLPAEPLLERALAALPPDAHGLTVLPFLAGERSPGWRGDARAALTGVSLDTGAVGILRAFMEAVAGRLALVYERLAPLAAPGHTIVASGGALAHSPAWRTILADSLGVPLALSGEPEASNRGAALLALEALGAPLPPPLPAAATLAPDPGRHAVYRAARERQRALYDSIVGPRLS